jgi:hypothetical protein
LVTGNIANDSERFELAKFLLQILKDATRNQTIMDPQGVLFWKGPSQEIPFQVSETDVSVDVVLLCPLPLAVHFQLITPGGSVLEPVTTTNIKYILDRDVACFRVMLPALASNPGGSHRGKWRAVLNLLHPTIVYKEILSKSRSRIEQEELLRVLKNFIEKPIPYQLAVYSYSNLALDARLYQDRYSPGATASIEAWLSEYLGKFRGQATVKANIRSPNGAQWDLPLKQDPQSGTFDGEFVLKQPGHYVIMIKAEGSTSGYSRFQRNKILTAGAWVGGKNSNDTDVSGSGRCKPHCCCKHSKEIPYVPRPLTSPITFSDLFSTDLLEYPLGASDTKKLVREKKLPGKKGSMFVVEDQDESSD